MAAGGNEVNGSGGLQMHILLMAGYILTSLMRTISEEVNTQPVVRVSLLASCSPWRPDLSAVFPAYFLLGERSSSASAESFLALLSRFLY